METMFSIALPLIICIPVVLMAMSFFQKAFPSTAHYFVMAVSAVPLAVAAKGAQGVLSGWLSIVAAVVFYVFILFAFAIAAAGLWDTYAKAHNGDG